MRVDYTNIGLSPITRTMMEQNLRLPEGMDSDLLDRIICSAIDYVEKVANICVVQKEVKISHEGFWRRYDLKWAVESITSVKINDEVVDPADYKLYNNNPAYLVIKNKTIYDDDIIDIEYVAKDNCQNQSAINAIIAYGTALYNNPDGLEQLDMRRINNLLTTIGH
jgi:hypothetical protein